MKLADIGMHLNKKNNFFERYKKLLAKSLLFVFIFTSILMPVSALGVDATTTTTTTTTSTSGSSSTVGTTAEALVQSTATCSVGNILSRLISSTIGKAIVQLTSYLTGFITTFIKDKAVQAVKSAASIATEVPVRDGDVLTEVVKNKQETRQLTAKETGTANTDFDSILSGFVSGLTNISLDSIMFCVINEIMAYITKSTIDWINSGFNGNPVFVENPGAFFEGIATTESSNFIKELSGSQGMVSNGISNTIVSIAEPLRDSVVNSIIGTSNQTFANKVSPTMSSSMTTNYDKFVSGETWLGKDAFMNLSRPENNYYGLKYMSESERLNQITREQQSQAQQLLQNSGYKSKTTCPSGKTRSDGSCYPYYSVVSVAGSQTKDELQSRGMMKYMRVSFANDFDSIITALVNQLIKIAVTEVFESSN